MRQADIFLESEGDAWFHRNRDKLGERNPVTAIIHDLDIKPQRVLEVGCSNGWRLAELRDKYGCEVYGVEPSRQAGIEAAALRVPVLQSSAAALPVSGQFDVVIYGYCLYLVDPADWLRIAAEADCLLAPHGYLIIHDFGDCAKPFARRYEHHDGLFAYHVDFANLWLGNPLYHRVHREFFLEDQMVTVLQKAATNAIEVRP